MERQRKQTRPSGFNHVRLFTDEQIARLCARYRYDPETGVIYSKRYNKPLNAKEMSGYMRTQVSSHPIVHIYYHRLCWLLYYKRNPRHVIDHINGNKQDNRIVNLRDVTQRENTRNKNFRRKEPSTGFVGIAYHPKNSITKDFYLTRSKYKNEYRSPYLCDCVRLRILHNRNV